ncbi:MAG TPA: ribonuclease P protein component [Candidatus Acidoferrales bacterium]|nr:ribonuclease P protein component [Candidatus Acidoferrales bacterium]
MASRPSDGSSATPAGNRARRFPRSVRLLHRPEFEAVYRNGRRRTSSQFVIFFRPNGAAQSRFGASVKKALGGAVVRNRIRRRIREVLRIHMPEIPNGWDIVIHPRATVARSQFSPLAMELVGLLRSALK